MALPLLVTMASATVAEDHQERTPWVESRS
jgi:hypothetical protein